MYVFNSRSSVTIEPGINGTVELTHHFAGPDAPSDWTCMRVLVDGEEFLSVSDEGLQRHQLMVDGEMYEGSLFQIGMDGSFSALDGLPDHAYEER
ncbi:MAG: hypothetical protein AAFR54_10495 [Planctomycetota bacterium]